MNQSILNKSRNDKFLLVLDLPPALKKTKDKIVESEYSSDIIQFSTFGSPVPAISIPEYKVAYSGQTYHASSLTRPAFGPITLKFLIDNGFQNYWILWKWMNLFNDPSNSSTELTEPVVFDTGFQLTTPMSEYTATINVFGLDEFNNKIISFKYTNAFITQLSQIDFSFQGGNEITCEATFVFGQLFIDLLKDVNSTVC